MRGRVVAVAALCAGVLSSAAAPVQPMPPEGLVVESTRAGLELSRLDGTGRRLLSSLPLRSPAFSPDGRAVVGVSRGSAYIVDVETGAAQVVARRAGELTSPVWSRDGTRVALSWLANDWCRGRRGATALLIVDRTAASTSVLRNVYRRRDPPAPAVYYEALAWSPDGRRLLYREESWHAGSNCGLLLGNNWRSEFILHAGLGGGHPTIVRSTYTGQSDWSADGSLIATRQDRCAILVTRRDGRVVRRWSRQFESETACADVSGRWLAWSRSSTELFVADGIRLIGLRPSDGRRRVLLSGPGFACPRELCTNHIVALAQGGSYVVVYGHRDGQSPQLFAVRTDGSGSTSFRAPSSSEFAVWMR